MRGNVRNSLKSIVFFNSENHRHNIFSENYKLFYQVSSKSFSAACFIDFLRLLARNFLRNDTFQIHINLLLSMSSLIRITGSSECYFDLLDSLLDV